MLKYVEGDLFDEIKPKLAKPDHTVYLPHVCNNVNVWSGGFVVPLAVAYPAAKEEYKKQGAKGPDGLVLGQTQYVHWQPNANEATLIICNMISQNTTQPPRPLMYNHLARCMTEIGYMAVNQRARTETEICCPMFGSGLAGGNWDFIEALIEDCWICNDIDVTVYYLPQFLPEGFVVPEDMV